MPFGHCCGIGLFSSEETLVTDGEVSLPEVFAGAGARGNLLFSCVVRTVAKG
jgi:hypothetical protein